MIRALLLALALAGCTPVLPDPVPVPVDPTPPTVLVIRLEPSKDWGSHTFPGGEPRPYTYRVKSPTQVTCATVLPEDVLNGGPGAVGAIEWELANCRGKGGDYPS